MESRPVPKNANGARRFGVSDSQPTQYDRRFTKTPEGRKYDNGLELRNGRPVASWQRRYFPHGYAHYGYYRQRYISGTTFISPFGFYFGIGDPYLDASHVRVFPPAVDFIDEPIYSGSNWTGWAVENGQNWVDRTDIDAAHPGLTSAMNELTEAFQNGNVDALVSLIDPNISIEVFLQGQYSYSMPSNDFVDLTRDAIRSTQTIDFNLTSLRAKAPNVFSASGTHRYRDSGGNERKVYVSYVLQDISGQWTLTQVGTAPDRIQGWQ